MEMHLQQVVEALKESQQRVAMLSKPVYGSGMVSSTGVIVSYSNDVIKVARSVGSWNVDYVSVPQLRQIRTTVKSRSKRDLARYGEYRVYWQYAPVALDAEGVLDVGSTLRQLFAKAS